MTNCYLFVFDEDELNKSNVYRINKDYLFLFDVISTLFVNLINGCSTRQYQQQAIISDITNVNGKQIGETISP